MSELTQAVARRIIDTVGAHGVPPEYGFQFFSVGFEPYLAIIEDEYLSSFIPQGGSAFKLVIGMYGGGKTHLLYSIRDVAWKHNFVVSYVTLSPGESPFHRLDLVYGAIARGILPPLTPEELLSGFEYGMASFLRGWYAMKFQECRSKGLSGEALYSELEADVERLSGVESLSFLRAIKASLRALAQRREDDFENICQWLTGESYDRKTHSRHGILQRIDRSTAFTMIRSLVQCLRQMGYNGLVVLLDEAERVPSLSTRQRDQHLSNLREVIDACGHTSFQGAMIFYAVPDDNFLEGRTQIYEALKQRLDTVFGGLNPAGVRINLESVVSDPVEFLVSIGQKLAEVYRVAYGCQFRDEHLAATITNVAGFAADQRYADEGYKRLFVKTIVRALHHLRQKGVPPSVDDLR
ncbi:MAG: BREX system ATP-binding domain-containing protein [Bacillota bacterium]